MLHPVLAQALATTHIEDLRRAAARRHAIRAARRAGHELQMAATSTHHGDPASTQLRVLRALNPRRDTNRGSSSSPAATPIGPRCPLGAESSDRLGIT